MCIDMRIDMCMDMRIDICGQVDPPQNPEQFVHRVGRTARLGRDGHALLLLHPSEDSYIEFLRIRNVPMSELSLSLSPDAKLLIKAKRLVRKDREVMCVYPRARTYSAHASMHHSTQ